MGTHYHYTRNMPGYMPESDPYIVTSKVEALQACECDLLDAREFAEGEDARKLTLALDDVRFQFHRHGHSLVHGPDGLAYEVTTCERDDCELSDPEEDR